MSRRTSTIMGAVTLATVALLAGCTPSVETEPEPSATSAEHHGFPVTIENPYGETVVPRAPQRIVTLGPDGTDALLALGVRGPVGAVLSDSGDPAELPVWTQEALDELAVDDPEVLPGGETLPYAEITALEPDLILAVSVELDRDRYEQLAAIAPTVATLPGTTSWQDAVSVVGMVMGEDEAAAAAIDSVDQKLTAITDAHPQLDGVTVAAATTAATDPTGTFSVFAEDASPVQLLEDLGFTIPASVVEGTRLDSSTFPVAADQAAGLTSDILVYYAATQAEYDAWLASPVAQSLAQVAGGNVAPVIGADLVQAVGSPSALSIPWGLDGLVAALGGTALGAVPAPTKG
ncbi:ABC transporter substrate-binding protein [Cnuibacter sp. UC19_7]|uniref:ABC transporter substrate-binding protein n=1 Tax=Cnuibacter sp. UC19_7 TaxID=3350166 RepID=UPI00366BCE0F